MKKILIIQENLLIGGIETLIVRMCNWFILNGYSVTLVLKNKGSLDSLINQSVKRIYSTFFYLFLSFPLFVKFVSLFWKELKDFEVIFTTNPKDFQKSLLLYKFSSIKPKLLTGVYHPLTYFGKKRYIFQTNHFLNLLHKIPDSVLLFMNNEVKKSHAVECRRKFENANIFPLPINITSEEKIDHKPKKFKILSIGNLKDFKSYNIYMLHIVKELSKKYTNIIYEIYGDGPLKPLMEKIIHEEKLSDNVFIKGQIPYNELNYALADTYVFIGMGTSVLEAAIRGIPTIVAIISDNDAVSYGYIYNLPRNNIGERLDCLKTIKVYNLIENLILLDDSQYQIECKKNYEYASYYNIDELMKNFLSIYKSQSDLSLNIPSGFYYKYYYLIVIGFLKSFMSKFKRVLK